MLSGKREEVSDTFSHHGMDSLPDGQCSLQLPLFRLPSRKAVAASSAVICFDGEEMPQGNAEEEREAGTQKSPYATSRDCLRLCP